MRYRVCTMTNNMNTYYVGVALLIAILIGRWAFSYLTHHRFRSWWDKGQQAIAVGNMVAAEAAFRECVRLMPIFSTVHRALGGVLARRGKYKEAEERLRFGAELEPRNPAGFIDLGLFLALCAPERTEDAINAFATAVAHAPNLKKSLAEEPRLERLRQHDRFRKLLESHE